MVLAFKKTERGPFLVLAQCAPLSSSALTGLLAYQALARCSCRPPSGRSARYPYLLGPPPIALAISYGSSSSQPRGPALRGQSGLSGQRPFELGGLSLLPDLERYYKSSVPDSIAATIWFTGTTKKSHAYVTLTDGFLILDHEAPSCASAFHSHHIDEKSPRALP